MYCRRCGTKLPDDSRFCQSCGTALSDEGIPTQEPLGKKQAKKKFKNKSNQIRTKCSASASAHKKAFDQYVKTKKALQKTANWGSPLTSELNSKLLSLEELFERLVQSDENSKREVADELINNCQLDMKWLDDAKQRMSAQKFALSKTESTSEDLENCSADEGMIIYVRNLSNEVTADELRRAFELFGTVSMARVVNGEGKLPGFGMVAMPSEIDGQMAFEALNGKNFKDRKMAIEVFRNSSPESKPSQPVAAVEDSKQIKCKMCGSTQIISGKRGYGTLDGVLGAVFLGPLGLLAGTVGSNDILLTCLKCGHKWRVP